MKIDLTPTFPHPSMPQRYSRVAFATVRPRVFYWLGTPLAVRRPPAPSLGDNPHAASGVLTVWWG